MQRSTPVRPTADQFLLGPHNLPSIAPKRFLPSHRGLTFVPHFQSADLSSSP